MEKAQALSISDAENVYSAVLQLVLNYKGFPNSFKASHKTVKWNTLNTDTSIGLFPLAGGVYLRKYVSGSYVAQFPFSMVFKASPTTNPDTIDCQVLLENLAKYMEKCGITFADEHITLDSITRTSPVYGSNQDSTVQEFATTMQLKYSYKK